MVRALGFEPSLSGARVRRNSTFAWRACRCHAGGGARTRTRQFKGLLLCRSSSAGVARDRGVEPRHCGAKTRRRPLTGSSRTLAPSPRIKRGTRPSDDRMIFVSTRGREVAETVRIELTTLPPEGSALPLRYVSLVAVGGLEPPPIRLMRPLPCRWATPHHWSRVRDLNPQCASRD